VPGVGLALAWDGGSHTVPTSDPAGVIAELAELELRWTWWSARTTATPLVAAGLRLRTCWDLGAVGRLLHGLRDDSPGAVWAAELGLPPPRAPRADLDLFDLDPASADDPVLADGQLSREWPAGFATRDLPNARRWAQVAVDLQQRQAARLGTLADHRPAHPTPSLALATAYAESSAALIAVELEHAGLPIDRATLTSLLTATIGKRPTDPDEERAARQARDDAVIRQFPGAHDVDLRSPAQVRALLARVGLDLPDTRSWRLEPHAASSPAIAALVSWRKADRLATTYGWRWLDTNVGADGRLRGAWGASDGGAGRMTAMAGLHNLPAELRPAVRAEPGHTLVRADLGQVEPRVLAAISGDPDLMLATHDADMYAPVAARLRCDRPAAKLAVLAAMYGQTSGSAGETMRVMEQAYPVAVAYLRTAEAAGRDHTDLRTYGGRLIRLSGAATDAAGEPVTSEVAAGHGRFARNAAVQGPAAELFKAWAATVRAALTQLRGETEPAGEIVLCLHDELLLQVPVDLADRATALVHGALASTVRWWAAGRDVRFVAEVTTGESWAEAHDSRP
jgi:DNA polymerase I